MDRRMLQYVIGPTVMLLSVMGILYAACAGAAQGLYFRARYGGGKRDRGAAIADCRLSYLLYPRNYRVCGLAADLLFEEARTADGAGEDALPARQDAQHWCERGLSLDAYNRELSLRMSAVLAAMPGCQAEAVAVWERYTNWHYWNVYNQYLLAGLYAWSGRKAEALARLDLLKGTRYFDAARRAIDEEMPFPRVE